MRNASSELDSENFGSIGQAIRAMRLEQETSQEELPHISTRDRSHLGRIERGERNLSILNLVRIAHGLGCKPSDVLRRAGLEGSKLSTEVGQEMRSSRGRCTGSG